MKEIKELVKQKLKDYSQNKRMMALLSYEMEHSTPGAEVYDAMQQLFWFIVTWYNIKKKIPNRIKTSIGYKHFGVRRSKKSSM